MRFSVQVWEIALGDDSWRRWCRSKKWRTKEAGEALRIPAQSTRQRMLRETVLVTITSFKPSADEIGVDGLVYTCII